MSQPLAPPVADTPQYATSNGGFRHSPRALVLRADSPAPGGYPRTFSLQASINKHARAVSPLLPAARRVWSWGDGKRTEDCLCPFLISTPTCRPATRRSCRENCPANSRPSKTPSPSLPVNAAARLTRSTLLYTVGQSANGLRSQVNPIFWTENQNRSTLVNV